MRSYMFDTFQMSGTDEKTFVETCQTLDDNTEMVRLDFTESHILHYMYPDGNDLIFQDIQPGESFRVKRTDTGTILQLDKSKKVNIKTLKEEKIAGMIKELDENSTLFFFEEPEEQVYFSSRTLLKTIKNLPIKETSSSIERDLLLAKNLDDQGDTELWALVRRKGEIRKIFALFAKKSKRANVLPLYKEAKAYGKGKLLSWSASQEKVQFVYGYDLEINEIKRRYPGLKYFPCHVFTLSDVGYYANTVTSAWMSEKSRQMFMTESVPIAEKVSKAIEKTIEQLYLDAEKLAENTHEELLSRKAMTKKEFSLYTESLARTANMHVSAGKKAIRSLASFAEDAYDGKPKVSRMDVIDTILGSISEDIYRGITVSEYPAEQMANHIAKRVIYDDWNPKKDMSLQKKLVQEGYVEVKQAARNLEMNEEELLEELSYVSA